MGPCKCAKCSSGAPKFGRYETWEEGAPWEHPGQAGAQLSPGTSSSSAGHALALGTWLVALPARNNELHPLLHLCCCWLWGSSRCIGMSCPMGPMQGDVYARSVLSLRAGPEHLLHAGDEQGHDVAADLLLGLLAVLSSWPWGFPPGPALQVSDVERPPHAPVALQIFFGVCLLLKWQWLRSRWAQETLRVNVVRHCMVYGLFFKSKMRSERQLACSRTFGEKIAPNLLSWTKK